MNTEICKKIIQEIFPEITFLNVALISNEFLATPSYFQLITLKVTDHQNKKHYFSVRAARNEKAQLRFLIDYYWDKFVFEHAKDFSSVNFIYCFSDKQLLLNNVQHNAVEKAFLPEGTSTSANSFYLVDSQNYIRQLNPDNEINIPDTEKTSDNKNSRALSLPLFSVITTVKNNKILLEQTIQSVINQEADDYEYIVADGGSVDGSTDVIKKYEKFITKWTSKSDGGLYEGMDNGIKLSSGIFFGILNSDDFYFTNSVFNTLQQSLTENKDADFFYGNIIVLTRSKKNNVVYKESTPQGLFQGRDSLRHTALFMKKSIYNDLGGFDFSYRIIADYKLKMALFSRKLKSVKINQTLAVKRDGGVSFLNPATIKELSRLSKETELNFPLRSRKIKLSVIRVVVKLIGYENYIRLKNLFA